MRTTLQTNMEAITVKEECEEISYGQELSDNLVQRPTTINNQFEEILIKEEPDINNEIEEENPVISDEQKRQSSIFIKEELNSENKCPTCDKRFTKLRNLKKHIYTHRDIKKYHCNLCDKWLKKRSTLENHMAIHAGNRVKFECSICHKLYVRKRTLNIHFRTHSADSAAYTHQEREKNQCPICGKMFSVSGNLKKHLKLVHSGIKDFRCNLCNKSFSEKSSLKYHMTSHIGKKEFECYICHQLFPNINNLKYHLNTHVSNDDDKTKDFQCCLCNKSFTSKTSFDYHNNAHKGIKQFQCQICQKSYSKNSALNVHLKIHTLNTIQNHTRPKIRKLYQQEDTNDLECPKCHKSFTVKRYLRKHLKMHLLDDQNTLVYNQMHANSIDSAKDNNLTVENMEDIFVKEEHELKIEETLIKEELNDYMDSEVCNNQKDN